MLSRMIAIFVTTFVLIGGLYFSCTPEFTIMRLNYALKERSVAQFEKAADVPAIAHNMVQDTFTNSIAQALGGGEVGQWISSNTTALFDDSLEVTLQEQIRSAVSIGTFIGVHDPSSGALTIDTEVRRLGFDNYRYVGPPYSEVQVTATTKLFAFDFVRDSDATTLTVYVELTKPKGAWFWKVTRILEPLGVRDWLSQHTLAKTLPCR